MKKLFVILVVLLTLSSFALSKTVTLTLSDNVNPTGTRYYCYHRLSSGSYSAADRRDLGTSKTYSWVMDGAALGTHYFACTAYAVDGEGVMESSYSNDFTWLNSPVAPTLSGLVAAVSRKEATLLASSTIPMTTTLAYGTARKPYRQTVTVSSTAEVNHTVILTKLAAHTLYVYRWTGIDSNGTVATFSGQFTTQ